MTSSAWEDLGYAIRQARLDEGWSLERLASEALGNGDRKGHVSQVEKGLRNLSPETIDKFDQALSLPDDIVRAAHLAPPPELKPAKTSKGKAPAAVKPVDEVDRDAERLLRRVEKDDGNLQVAEALLTALAYEFAEEQYRDLQTAYTALRKALEAAEEIRKRGEMPKGNADDQLARVMAEVTALNNQGQLEEADALLEAEERRMRDDHQALQDRMDEAQRQMLEQRLNQDRLRNDPAAAAARLIADIEQRPDQGKLFWAIDDLADEWREAGERTGDIFALRVARQIARVNYDRHKSKAPLVAAGLYTLGGCYLRLAERSTRSRDLELAHNALKTARDKTSKTKEPQNWAVQQHGYGSVLREMGDRAGDAALLRDAVAAFRAVVEVVGQHENEKHTWNNLGNSLQKLGEVTQDPGPAAEAVETLTTALSLKDKDTDPLDWELTQNNLALALRWQGARTGDRDLLQQSREGYRACEALEIRDEAAFIWARLQWNIADLALARFDLDPDPAYLDEAVTHVRAGREVFAEGSDYQTQRCDELLEKVEAARAVL